MREDRHWDLSTVVYLGSAVWRSSEQHAVCGGCGVVGDSWQEVFEEHPAHEVLAVVYADLLEDRLEMVLNGVRGDEQRRADLRGRAAAHDKVCHLALAPGEAIGAEQQLDDIHRRCGRDDHRDAIRRVCDA